MIRRIMVFALLAAQVNFYPCCALARNDNDNATQKVWAGDEDRDPALTWDFGKVKQGEMVEHNFKVKNTSKIALNVKDVSSSCGCTKSEILKKKLLPGEETELVVRFNTSDYPGKQEKFVYLYTDSLDKAVEKYIIKGEVLVSNTRPRD